MVLSFLRAGPGGTGKPGPHGNDGVPSPSGVFGGQKRIVTPASFPPSFTSVKPGLSAAYASSWTRFMRS